jgi:glycosyltransferase involved in cell wall biosynthesis
MSGPPSQYTPDPTLAARGNYVRESRPLRIRHMANATTAQRRRNDGAFRRVAGKINVGFCGPALAAVGGVETWHRLLLPRLASRFHVVGYAPAHLVEGRPADALRAAGIVLAEGHDAIKALCRLSDVIVTWGAVLGGIETGDTPIVVVAHADAANEWQRQWLEHVRPRAAVVVGVSSAAGCEVTIPNAVECLEAVDRTGHDGRTLGYVGRLNEDKRPWKALDALAKLPGWRLKVAGVGPLRGNLESKAAALGVADRVEWLGAVEVDTDLWASLSCVIVPSESEGFGYTIAEAWAHRVPVVASPVGLAREWPEFCRLVPDGADAGEWAQMIRWGAMDGFRAAQSRDWVCRELGLDRWADAWGDLIASVAPKPAPPGVGDHFHATATAWGLKALPGCGCEDSRREMNALGPDGCEAHRERLVATVVQRARDGKFDASEAPPGVRAMLSAGLWLDGLSVDVLTPAVGRFLDSAIAMARSAPASRSTM